MKLERLKESNEEKVNIVDVFFILYENEWIESVLFYVYLILNERKYNKYFIILLVEDVKKLSNFLY